MRARRHLALPDGHRLTWRQLLRVAKHTGEADWNAYFKELWKGEVNEKTLDDFVKSYKGEQMYKLCRR